MNYQSIIFSKYLSDKAMTLLVSDEALISKILRFEMALARAQAKLNIIPQQSADEIEKVLSILKIEPINLRDGTLENGIPTVTLLSLVKDRLSKEAKTHLHFGATSQDAMDTAQVLIIRDAIGIIKEKVRTIIDNMGKLTEKYGGAVCMARTRGQLAVPITFSVKLNAWKLPLQRQLARLDEILRRVLQVQLGGAAGDLSAYKDKGEALVKALAVELELSPASSWHAQRDNFSEFTNWLAMLTGVLGKMGADILVMSQTEVGEVIENSEGGGKSSSMPHKNNPVLSEAMVALSRLNATLQMQQLQSLVHVNERDAIAWILEWNAMPQMLINVSTAMNHAITISTKMKIDTVKMKSNVEKFMKNNY
jgi:3-carboxy-cis,cis-muconate cycloisomerase